MNRIPSLIAALAVMVFVAPSEPPREQNRPPSSATPISHLKITGAVRTPLDFSSADLKALPRKTLKVINPHAKKSEAYEGVPLAELLHRAGVPDGENLRGPAMTTYVLAEASDGYRVVFSLAELDPGIVDSDILVADTVDGAPLDAKHGPFQLIVPHDKRAARWVRMLQTITVGLPAK